MHTRTATNFVPSITICPLCGGNVEFVNNSHVYGKPLGDWPMIYLCRICYAFVHCHPGSTTPLGTMANRETRQARKLAHMVFDPLWKRGEMTRSQAYEWLAGELGITEDKCHIGMFNAEQCQRVVEAVKARGNDQHDRDA